MRLITYTIIVSLFTLTLLKAQDPVPAEPQQGPFLISNVKAHIGDGRVIENAVIGVDSGKITLVANANTVRIDRTKYDRMIDGSGMEAFPGFIAPNTTLGINEIEAVRATNDYRETGDMNPSVRSLIAYNTDSKVTPTVRSNGILLAQIVPSGGTIPGMSSVVQLDAWNWEDAAYLADDGIHLNWPSYYGWRRRGGSATIAKSENYDEQVRSIVSFLKESRAYCRLEEPETSNLKMEAMCRLFNGESRLYIHVNQAKAIAGAIHWLKDFHIPMVIVGGREADQVASLLKKEAVPVILEPTHRLPGREDSPVDEAFTLPKDLFDAGVMFCFSQDGFWQQRTLPHQAGQAVSYGLPYEVAIAGLTKYPAQILGIGDRTGTLEAGKDANIILSEGDPLDMRGNRIRHAFIQGREIDLDNKQKQLYRKYSEKYKHEMN